MALLALHMSCLNAKKSFIIQIFSGPFNLSGEWTGVIGDVVTGKYQFSLNSWTFTTERQKVLSFVPSVIDRFVFLLIPSLPDFDPELLYRPFTNSAWLCIFFFFITACCFATS